jgi:hypothetical protein
MPTTVVWVTTRFVGYHRWKDAPDNVSFLRDYHRHVFHVQVAVDVLGHDREVEFFTLKSRVDAYIDHNWAGRKFDASCEHIAADLQKQFGAAWVEVSEDGENGAVVKGPPVIVAEEVPEAVPAVLPAREVKTRCFLGTEAEGPYRGKRVLYVPGCVSVEGFRAVYNALPHEPDRVYLGAGNNREVSHQLASAVEKVILNKHIDIEVKAVPPWLKDFKARYPEITVISLDPADILVCDYLKLDLGEHLVWIGEYKAHFVTRIDDPLYQHDQFV